MTFQVIHSACKATEWDTLGNGPLLRLLMTLESVVWSGVQGVCGYGLMIIYAAHWGVWEKTPHASCSTFQNNATVNKEQFIRRSVPVVSWA